MCGIAGLLAPESDKKTLSLMIAVLAHRGPDDQGTWEGKAGDMSLGLGATRLAILDLSPSGHQPMVDPQTGTVILFNGEIYNFAELRKELEKSGEHSFRSTGDTEVALKAHLSWGPNFFSLLRGMFAIAIWDPLRQKLFLARDPLGIKPLYYTKGPEGRLAFASEVRPLLQVPWVSREVDPLGLASYLAYGSVQDPMTLLTAIRSLEAGHILTVERHARKSEWRGPVSYWSLPNISTTPFDPVVPYKLDNVAHKLREVLEGSVRAHLASDVSIGAFLSSGIDSSSLVALMSESMSRPVQTICVGMKDDPFDESGRARQIANHFGTLHTEVQLSASDFLLDFPRWLASIDQPSTDGANVWLTSKIARQLGLKVVVSGLGGDELFGGYPSFSRVPRAVRALAAILYMPKVVRKQAAAVLEKVRLRSLSKLAALLLSDGSTLESYLVMRRILLSKECLALMDPAFSDLTEGVALGPEQEAKLRRLSTTSDVINAVSTLEMMTYMTHTLLRDTDQASMAHSLEIRVPFVDPCVINYVLSIPGKLKVDGISYKPLLIRAMADKLTGCSTARTKLGFMFPFDRWLRNDLRELVESELRRLCRGHLPIRAEAIWSLWNRFLAGDPRTNASQMLTLYNLADWLDRNEII